MHVAQLCSGMWCSHGGRGQLRHRLQCGWTLSAGCSVREADEKVVVGVLPAAGHGRSADGSALKLRASLGLSGKESAMGQHTGRHG